MMFQELLPATVYEVFFVLTRIAAIVMVMPGIGEIYVPPRARMALAFVISLLLTPLVLDSIPPMPDSAVLVAVLLIGEIVIGLFIGITGQILLSALQTAGTVIAFQSSLANAFIFNPATAQQSSIFGSFLGAIGLLLIFSADLHHIIFAAMTDSYILFPPGDFGFTGDFAEYMARLVAGSFTMALQLSAPFLAVGLVFYLGLGLLARLMPQVQIFFVAIPMQLLMGISIFLPTLSMIGFWFMDYYETNMIEFLSR